MPIGVETIKSSDMKNILIIICSLIILNSCKSSSDLFVDRYIPDETKLQEVKTTEDVFNQKDLETIYANKKKVKVALFLPFSGKYSELSWSLYNSALMSLFDNDINHNLELVLIDSKDNAVEASQQFRQIRDRKIKIVIGPIFSNFTNGISKNALRNSIKVISLSNNQDLMNNIDEENDGAVFIAGFLPEQEIDRLVSFSIAQNKNNFAILAPNSNYGLTINKLLRNVIDKRFGNLIQSELYNKNSKNSLKSSVKRIINSYKVSSELAEGGGNKLSEDFVVEESDKNYADIIFVASNNVDNLNMINKLVKKYNKSERQIKIAAISGLEDLSKLNNNSLSDIWFSAPIYGRFQSFKKEYKQIYGDEPTRISSIIYDSVAAIAQIVEKSESSNPKIADFVNYQNGEKNGFEGIDGKFRFLENGLVQRNLAIFEVNSSQIKMIDQPAEILLEY